MNWRSFVRLKNPAATALMARMRINPKDRVRAKVQMLRMLASLRLNRDKPDLIAGFVETYLTLSPKEELALAKEIATLTNGREKKTVMELMMSWERKGLEKGLIKGRKQGRREGELALTRRLLGLRVGKLSPTIDKELQHLSERRLGQLAEALLDFRSSRDLRRWLACPPNGRAKK